MGTKVALPKISSMKVVYPINVAFALIECRKLLKERMQFNVSFGDNGQIFITFPEKKNGTHPAASDE